MRFSEMRDKLIKNFMEQTENVPHLLKADIDKEELWKFYLNSFSENKKEYPKNCECSDCEEFIKTMGSVIIKKDNKIQTIWDFKTNDTEYQLILEAMSGFVKSHSILGVYKIEKKKIGRFYTYEERKDGYIQKWPHFYLELPDKFVDKNRGNEDKFL